MRQSREAVDRPFDRIEVPRQEFPQLCKCQLAAQKQVLCRHWCSTLLSSHARIRALHDTGANFCRRRATISSVSAVVHFAVAQIEKGFTR